MTVTELFIPSTSLPAWLGILLVLAILGALVGSLRAYRRIYPDQAEGTRKLLHIGMGLVTVTFPWLFDETWPVLALAAVTIPGLLLVRRSALLKRHLGGVIHGVERESLGEVYFPLAIAILFVLAHDRPLLYAIPVLVLTLADATAALIGTTYGRRQFSTMEGERKSAEGSIAFFLVAFFAVHVPLLAATSTGRVESLLIAATIAVLITLTEAVAWRGLDNLFVPLATFAALEVYLQLTAVELLVHVSLLSALAVFALLGRRTTTMDEGAILGAILAGYVIWTLGGWQWILIPALLVLRDRVMPMDRSDAARRHGHIHTAHAVLSTALPGLLWVFVARVFERPELLYPFAIGFAVHLGVYELAKARRLQPDAPIRPLLLQSALLAWALQVIPYGLLAVRDLVGAALVLLALPIITVAIAGFYRTQAFGLDLPRDSVRWLRQSAWATVGSVAGLAPLLAATPVAGGVR